MGNYNAKSLILSLNLHLLILGTLQDFSDFFLVDGLASIVKLEFILRASHSEDFEAVYLWDELRRWRKGLIKVLEENVRKTCPEIRSINVELLLSR